MAKMMEAQGLLFCDVSDYTVFVNQLKEGELRFYAEVYEGFLKKMMELRYAWKGKYLADRMGDGFLWFDFDAGTDGLSLLDFSEQALMPLAEAFLKSVKVLAGPVPYAEVRLDDRTAGRQSTSRIDFVSPEINRAARVTSLPESEDFRLLANRTFRDRLAEHRPDYYTG